MATTFPQDTAAFTKLLQTPPPPGTPYAGPIPGTETEGRSAIYRHWRFINQPLLETFDPKHQTVHDLFEHSAATRASKRCLGWRPWNTATKTWEEKYVWITYAEVAERRKNLGAGIVDLHEAAGITGKYGVGLWAQNRPEWQISGRFISWSCTPPVIADASISRVCPSLPVTLASFSVRDSWA